MIWLTSSRETSQEVKHRSIPAEQVLLCVTMKEVSAETGKKKSTFLSFSGSTCVYVGGHFKVTLQHQFTLVLIVFGIAGLLNRRFFFFQSPNVHIVKCTTYIMV